MNQKKEGYRAALGRLPIENPTEDDMAALCPHLTREQAIAAFTGGEKGYMACPPLRIRGAFQIVSFTDAFIDPLHESGPQPYPPQLTYLFASRTPRSYADGQSHGNTCTGYKHMAEAIAYAERVWDDELIIDAWTDVSEFIIQDPTDLTPSGYPKTKAMLYVCFDRKLGDLLDSPTQPLSILIDEAVTEMTLDKHVHYELKGYRGGGTEFNCAHCGGGLGLSSCYGCGLRYTDNKTRGSTDIPLTRKMVDFLQANGHVFGQEPEIAWHIEAQRHEERLRRIAERQQRAAHSA